LILLGSQRARQTVFLTGNIVATKQMGKSRELLGPGEFFQHAAQVDHIPGASDGSQWRVARAQEDQPAEKVWITTQLLERVNLRILSAEINEEVPDGCTVAPDG